MTLPSTQGSKTEHHEEKWRTGNNLEVLVIPKTGTKAILHCSRIEHIHHSLIMK